MKIAAWSDGHGTLPEIKGPADVMVIAGDISPLYDQRRIEIVKDWFETTFFDYVDKAPVEKVIFVAGNHDFFFEYLFEVAIKRIISENEKVKDKLIYLQGEMYEYKGIRFYGCPWCTGPVGWAFSPDYRDTNDWIHDKYSNIPNCDVLITHQPPRVGYVGASTFSNGFIRDFGSEDLAAVIKDKDIKYNICGHIHTGTHNGVSYDKTTIYNVSLKDEDYKDVYPVTYIEI